MIRRGERTASEMKQAKWGWTMRVTCREVGGKGSEKQEKNASQRGVRQRGDDNCQRVV